MARRFFEVPRLPAFDAVNFSCTVKLGGTVATVGFPDIGLQGFAPGKVTSDG
jgi:hypothetical protein